MMRVPAHVDGPTTVLDAWSPTLPGAAVQPTGAVYFVAQNTGDTPQRITAVSCDCARAIEIHETINQNGKMSMQPVVGVDIPPKSKVEFKPGGLHVMLIGPKRAYTVGEKFKLTLRFSDNRETTFDVLARER